MASKAAPGVAISHLVFNVRDLEASHRFYTEALGFEQCAQLTHTMDMRFYRADPTHHHDIALVQTTEPADAPRRWSLVDTTVGVNHLALSFPDRETWLAQLAHMQEIGVEFLVRGNHGMTHSAYVQDPDGNGIEILYNLPEEVWGADVDAALNYFEYVPTDGDGSLEDRTDYQHFGPDYEPPVAVPGRIVTR